MISELTEKNCGNCSYWNCDTGFCEIEMICKIKNEVCEFWEMQKL